MILLALCLQGSLLARPLYLAEDPPELRSARNILILFDGAEREREPVGRTRDQAIELAAGISERLRAGDDFAELAARHSQAWNALQGAVLGTFPEGMLEAPLDAFLFAAEPGTLSAPIVGRDGVHLLERIDTLAGVRQILCTGEGARERAGELLAQLAAGADFAQLAREHCRDPASAPRGGDFAIYERGPRDRLLKAAAFGARPGEIVGPIETPLGWHIVQRVDPALLDPSLRETTVVRAQGLLIAYSGAFAAPAGLHRTQEDAEGLALAIQRDIAAGKPFEELARVRNDDPGGVERVGDLGWIHRRNPDLPLFMDQLFLVKAGELVEGPIQTAAGYVVLRRTR